MPPPITTKDAHVLIPGILEYVILHVKEKLYLQMEFQLIKSADLDMGRL